VDALAPKLNPMTVPWADDWGCAEGVEVDYGARMRKQGMSMSMG
jgi:hypothetical protein